MGVIMEKSAGAQGIFWVRGSRLPSPVLPLSSQILTGTTTTHKTSGSSTFFDPDSRGENPQNGQLCPIRSSAPSGENGIAFGQKSWPDSRPQNGSFSEGQADHKP